LLATKFTSITKMHGATHIKVQIPILLRGQSRDQISLTCFFKFRLIYNAFTLVEWKNPFNIYVAVERKRAIKLPRQTE
jgi:hypothetical protein